MAGPTAVNTERWWKADAITASDNDPVTTWPDSSGNAGDLTGGSPLYKTGILNSLPVVRFDGVDDSFTATLAADTSRTIFVIAKQDTAINSRAVFDIGTGAARLENFSGAWFWELNQAGGAPSFGGTPTNWTTVTLRVNSASSLDAYLDAGSAQNFDPHDSVTTATGWTVGSGVSATFPWNGDIAEIVVYDTALSDADRGDVYTALFNKWFVTPFTIPALVNDIPLVGSSAFAPGLGGPGTDKLGDMR